MQQKVRADFTGRLGSHNLDPCGGCIFNDVPQVHVLRTCPSANGSIFRGSGNVGGWDRAGGVKH